ncbi:hypothetical protein PybrP1_000524, partial [[Pythium] brassicae (nom. inval.)]
QDGARPSTIKIRVAAASVLEVYLDTNCRFTLSAMRVLEECLDTDCRLTF